MAFWLQIEGLARTSSKPQRVWTGLNVLVVPLIAMAALAGGMAGACGSPVAGWRWQAWR